MSARYRGILFDLDGTLVDSLELILASFRHTMATHLGRVPPDDEWKKTMGTPLREQLKAFSDDPALREAMFQTYIEHNQAHHERLIRPFPGLGDAVTAVHRAGYRLGVVTSKIREHALRELRSLDLDGLFDGLVSASDVQRPKPDPQPVVLGLQSLELEPDAALLVGDSLYDLQSGRAAGVDTAAALWGPFERSQLEPGAPDYWLEDAGSLLALLDIRPAEVDRG